MKRVSIISSVIGLAIMVMLSLGVMSGVKAEDNMSGLKFPQGTATPSEVCGTCHVSIYREFAYGFGSDMKYKEMIRVSKNEPA